MLGILLLFVPVVSAQEPDVHVPAAIVFNPQTDATLWSRDAHVQRPIASLTKIMTAAVLMDSNPDFARTILVQPSDVRHASTTVLKARDHVSIGTLLHLMLIGSDNAAARVLARATAGSIPAFVQRMNAKAAALGLRDTRYTDPSGLLQTNHSSAYDIARLLYVISANAEITSITQTPMYSATIGRRIVHVLSTDHLVRDGSVPIVAAKTGFIRESGFCLAAMIINNNQPIVMVVMGASSNADRFVEMRKLYQWVTSIKVIDGIPTITGLMEQIGERVCLFPDNVSVRGEEFIKTLESFHARPYRDSGGYAVGYGMHYWHGRRVTRLYPRFVAREQADEEFHKQIPKFEEIVKESVCGVLSQSQFDALTSLAYNLGRVNTRIVNKITAAEDVKLQDFLVTATVRHRPCAALIDRRRAEFELFTNM